MSKLTHAKESTTGASATATGGPVLNRPLERRLSEEKAPVNRKSPFGLAFRRIHRALHSDPEKRKTLTRGEAIQLTLLHCANEVLTQMGFSKEYEGKTEKGSRMLVFDTFTTSNILVIIPKTDLSVVLVIPASYHEGDVSKTELYEKGHLSNIIKGLKERGINRIHVIGWDKDTWPKDILPKPPSGEGGAIETVYAIVPAIGIPPSGRVIAYCETYEDAVAILRSPASALPPGYDVTTKTTGYFVVELENFARGAEEATYSERSHA